MAQRSLELVLKVVRDNNREILALQQQLQQSFNSIKISPDVDLAGLQKGVQGVTGGITESLSGATGLAFQFNQVTAAVSTVTAVTQQLAGVINQTLLQPVEKFNAQILSSQTNLAAAVKIFQNGVEVIDPTKKIQATRDTIEDLLKQVERDTESLVGVTSEQVFGITDILLRNSAQIQGQFDQTKTTFKDSLAALTKGFAAELKVSGIGFFQASQEISSIFRGDITADSLIAKKLGLDNPQINKLKSQGKLVEEIINRLQTSVAGNAIAATTSLSGPLSNIQDFFQRLSREIGKPLFQPLVESLNGVYNTLKQFEPQIFGPLTQISDVVGQKLGDFVKNFGANFQQIAAAVQPSVESIKRAFSGLKDFTQTIVEDYGPQLQANFGANLKSSFAVVSTVVGTVADSFAILFKVIKQVLDLPVTQFLVNGLLKGIEAVNLGLAALLTTGNELRGNFADTFGKLLDITEKIRNSFEPIVPLLKGVAEGVLQAIAPILPGIQAIVPGFELLKNTVEPVGQLFQQAFQGIGGFVTGALKDADAAVDGFATRIKNVVRGIVENPAFQAVAKVLRINIDGIKADLDRIDASAKQSVTNAQQAGKAAQDALKGDGKKGNDNITFQQFQVEQLGTSYEQLKKKADAALRTLQSGGDKNQAPQFQKSASDLVKLTQQQVELGQITQEEGEKRLNAIASNSRVEVEVQQSALKTITDLRKSALDRQIKDIDAKTADIANAVKRGNLTELQGAEETTRLKQEQFALQLADTKRAIEAEQKAIAGGTGSATRLNALKQQQKALNEGLEKEQVEGSERVQNARFNAIQKAEDKALKVVKDAENQRQIETQKLVNQGVLRQEEANQARINSTKKTIEAELKLQQDVLKKLEATPKSNDPALEKDRQEKIRQARTDTSNLTLKLLEVEKQAQDANAAVVQARIDRQLKAEQNALTEQKLPLEAILQANEAISKSIESRQSLLKAEGDIIRANAELTQANYSNAIKLLESANTEEERLRSQQEQRQNLAKRLSSAKSPEETASALKEFAANERRLKQEQEIKGLKIEAAQANIVAIEQQNQLEEQSLQLEQEKTKLVQEQEKLRLNIAKIEAESALATAEAERAKLNARKDATAEEKRAADLSVKAAQSRLTGATRAESLFTESQKNQNAIFAAQNRQQQVQQGIRLNAARADLAALTPGSADDRALAQQNIGFARNAAQISTAPIQQQVQSALNQAGNVIPLQAQTNVVDMGALLVEVRALRDDLKTARPLDVTVNNQISGQKLDESTLANMASRRTVDLLTQSLKSI